MLLAVFDSGFSMTLNRELAKLSVSSCDSAKDMRTTLRTFELIYWILAAFVFLLVFLMAPWLAESWLKSESLALETVEQSIKMMGLIAALQMLTGFYSGGLLGLQKQVTLNIFRVVFSTIRNAGAVLILWLIAPSIECFFLWHLLSSILQVFVAAFILWHLLPKCNAPVKFQLYVLKNNYKFVGGMFFITVLAVLLTQVDKLLLSKFITLEMFAYYMLASTLAMSLNQLIGPLFDAYYPRYTSYVEQGNFNLLKREYHQSSQIMAIIIIPVALIIVFFSKELLLIWTQNNEVAENTHLLLSILVIGFALNSLLHLPYALQLAYGWTRLSILINSFSLVILLPLLIYTVPIYGSIGAATVWLLFNLATFIVSLHMMNKRLLKGELLTWCYKDIGIPLFFSFLVVCTFSVIIHHLTLSLSELAIFIIGVYFFAFIAALLATNTGNEWLKKKNLSVRVK